MLRIRVPQDGFVEIAEEADDEGTFDESLMAILRLLRRAAREHDTQKTHLLTVSLHAFLYYKGGNYAIPTQTQQRGAQSSVAPAQQTVPPPPLHGTEQQPSG